MGVMVRYPHTFGQIVYIHPSHHSWGFLSILSCHGYWLAKTRFWLRSRGDVSASIRLNRLPLAQACFNYPLINTTHSWFSVSTSPISFPLPWEKISFPSSCLPILQAFWPSTTPAHVVYTFESENETDLRILVGKAKTCNQSLWIKLKNQYQLCVCATNEEHAV